MRSSSSVRNGDTEMDDELYGILRENGYDHIVFGDELEHRIEVFIEGEIADDLSFDFNDMFGTAQVVELVKPYIERRFAWADSVEVTLKENNNV